MHPKFPYATIPVSQPIDAIIGVPPSAPVAKKDLSINSVYKQDARRYEIVNQTAIVIKGIFSWTCFSQLLLFANGPRTNDESDNDPRCAAA